jgi:hypothetical protein
MARISRRERMRGVLARWRRSGLSAAAFCRQEGMAPQTLWYWKHALGSTSQVVVGASQVSPGVDLVPVRVMNHVAGGRAPGELEIMLASGERVMVHKGVSSQLLREVLTMLRERC